MAGLMNSGNQKWGFHPGKDFNSLPCCRAQLFFKLEVARREPACLKRAQIVRLIVNSTVLSPKRLFETEQTHPKLEQLTAPTNSPRAVNLMNSKGLEYKRERYSKCQNPKGSVPWISLEQKPPASAESSGPYTSRWV